MPADEVGLRLPQDKFNFTLAMLLATIFIVFVLAISITLGAQEAKPFIETIFFQLTMPGLAEEITFRGIFLAILNHFLGKEWRLGKTKFGWGIIMVTLLFIMAHVYKYDKSTHQLVWCVQDGADCLGLVMVAFAGCLLGYLRERSNSIWPCVVLHNLINLIPTFF